MVLTVCTTALNVADIKQGALESAAQHMALVIKIIDDIKFIAPAQLLELATPCSDAITGADEWAAITAAQKNHRCKGCYELECKMLTIE